MLVCPCCASQRIPDGASWEGDFAMRAALHGLAIYKQCTNPAHVCVSCYSYSGSDFSLMQAHQTPWRFNRVDLAQSHSSLATDMKQGSRAFILLHKNEREALLAGPGSCSSKRRQQGTSRQQQINRFPVRSAGTSAAKSATESTPGVSLACPKTTGSFRD